MSPPIDPTPRSSYFPRPPYSHWNEDQDFMWWDEVGKHAATQAEEPVDPDDYLDRGDWDDLDDEEDEQ